MMAAAIDGPPLVKPDRAAMHAHLTHLFGGLETDPRYRDGRIEIGTLDRVRFFRLTELSRAVEYAMRRTEAGDKVYVHCGLICHDYRKVVVHDDALRRNENPCIGHSGADGVLCWPSLWGESDHKHLRYDRTLRGEARNVARLAAFENVAKDHGFAWTWTHATGAVPSLRLQGFARLTEPATPDDPGFWAVVKSVAQNGALDVGATNSSQVLRLCGSVSFAGSTVKDAEIDEAPRVTEPVKVLSTNAARVDLEGLYGALDCLGLLKVEGGAGGPLSAVRDLEALRRIVKAPEGIEPLDRDAVRRWLREFVREAVEVVEGRRIDILKRARAIGGLLWTGHFAPEDVIDAASETDDPLGDDPGFSLVAAYRLNGGEDANGGNGLDRGILDAMATGSKAPWRTIPKLAQRPSTGEAFGAVPEDDDEEGERDEAEKPRRARLKTFAAFIREYAPPEFIVDSIVQRGCLYTLTARTGAGKTVLLASAAIAVAAGLNTVLGADVQRGRVAYFSFENPDDFRLKLIAAQKAHGLAVEDIGDRVLICDARVKPQDMRKLLRKAGGEFALIVIDTLAAAFDGDDSNSNNQSGEFMRRLRPLCALPGKPAVVVAAHPVKGAQRDNLAPYGGGAVVNEVDGNLTLWKAEGRGLVELHWQVKLRGLEFAPMHYAVEAPECPGLRDGKGRPLRLPVLKHMPSDSAAVAAMQAERAAENETVALLRALSAKPDATVRDLEATIGRKRTAIGARLKRLEAEKLIEATVNGSRVLTAKGRKMIAAADDEARALFEAADEA